MKIVVENRSNVGNPCALQKVDGPWIRPGQSQVRRPRREIENYRRRPCPRRGRGACRDRIVRRTLRPRPGQSPHRPATRHRPALLAPPMPPPPQVSQRRLCRPGRARQPSLPPGRQVGRPNGVEDGLPCRSASWTLRRITRGRAGLGRLRELRTGSAGCSTGGAGWRQLLAKPSASRVRLRRSTRLRAVLQEQLLPGFENGGGVPGRAADGGDVRRGGAGQPSVSEDMRKTVYRVWTRRAIECRPALDFSRESQAQGPAGATAALCKAGTA